MGSTASSEDGVSVDSTGTTTSFCLEQGRQVLNAEAASFQCSILSPTIQSFIHLMPTLPNG